MHATYGDMIEALGITWSVIDAREITGSGQWARRAYVRPVAPGSGLPLETARLGRSERDWISVTIEQHEPTGQLRIFARCSSVRRPDLTDKQRRDIQDALSEYSWQLPPLDAATRLARLLSLAEGAGARGSCYASELSLRLDVRTHLELTPDELRADHAAQIIDAACAAFRRHFAREIST